MIETIDSQDTIETATPPAVLKRRLSRHSQRRVAFYAPDSATLALDGANAGRVQLLTLDGYSASDLLGFCASLPERERPRTVFLCGGDSAATTPPVSWWREPLGLGWTLARWHNAADRRTGVYSRDGVTLDLRMAAPWFDASGAALDPACCLVAWRQLLRDLRGAFGDLTTLLTTPAMTGMELLEASFPQGLQVATLPGELRELLAEITTQGRRELFSPFTRTISDLYEVDARWMYAACLHHLPVGRSVQDRDHEYAGFTPGFYLVDAQVPGNWGHIGLLPDLETLHGPSGVRYPRRPRQWMQSWCTGAELDLARRSGWRTTIQQRILWPETHQRPDVTKQWIGRLRSLREAQLTAGTPTAPLLASAYRHLVIDPVGRWFSRETEEHGMLPLERIGELPPDAVPHIEQVGAQAMVLWSRETPLSAEWLRYAHPEWAAMVWGRARARLATQAMNYPLGSLVALRTDGIWTTANPYDLAVNDDDTRPGAWRVKSYLAGPQPWPTSEAQFVSLMRLARQGEDK
jgi:hypothetical protein